MPFVSAFETEPMSFRPLVDPSNTVVVASQTPLGTPRSDMDRRPCRVTTGLVAIDAPRKPCRAPSHDVDIVVFDAILSLTRVVVPVVKYGKAGR